MLKTTEGSTARLLQLCAGYFTLYILNGLTVKYFQGSAHKGFPGMSEMGYLAYNTIVANLLAIAIVLALRWYRLQTTVRRTSLWGLSFPSEYLYIIPSGICTAIVIPTTTLMYTLPISVMVAMIIMRGSVLIISRIVDEIQIRLGILKKKVYMEENLAVCFALLAICVNLFGVKPGGFAFMKSSAARLILGSYITAYAVRIYIMNYYKNTRPAGQTLDNKGFFAIEQIAASVALFTLGGVMFFAPVWFGHHIPQIDQFRHAFLQPEAKWQWAALAGVIYGGIAFVSVFIFMFKGRTATFAGLANRLTSLSAGTISTLLFAVFFGGAFPKSEDWIALGLILVAVIFVVKAERKRVAELGLKPV
jgi:hypothetical protein